MFEGRMQEQGSINQFKTVKVTQPDHLCAVQIATREFCQSIGFNEIDVFDTVVGVFDLAHRLFIENPSSGEVELRRIKRNGEYRLKAQARCREGEMGFLTTHSATFYPRNAHDGLGSSPFYPKN